MAGSTTGAATDSFAQAHATLLKQSDLQFSFPVWQPPAPPPEWLKAIGEFFRWMAPVFPYIFYGGLILGGLVIAGFLLRELIGVKFPSLRRKRKATVAEEWRPTAARARTLLEDADRLAADGRFDEAVHLILFRSIEDIDDHWPRLVRPSLTSRDIAAHEGLPEAARRTFSDIARIVERSFFGGAKLAAGDFGFCRQAYESFAFGARA